VLGLDLVATTVRRTAVLMVMALVLASQMVVATALPATAASATTCRVRNLGTNVTKLSLQGSVTLARNGHRLTVRGTCHGVTDMGKNLRITGVTSETTGRPTLDADRKGGPDHLEGRHCRHRGPPHPWRLGRRTAAAC
jgi:hypothetical protein